MSTFGSYSWSSVGSSLTWIQTEMSFSFSISWTSQKKNTLSGWGNLSQLIKSQTLTLGRNDSFSGLSGELKSTNSKSFWDVKKSVVISDSTNDSNDSGVKLGLSLSDRGFIVWKSSGDSGDGDRVSVEPGLIESFMNSCVESRLSSSAKERVKLNQSFNILVGRLCFSDTSIGDSSSSD